MTRFVLGVDGGGSKTIALLADRSGRVVGAGRGGNSCIYRAHSPDAAIAEISTAVGEACAQAAVSLDQVASATLTLAGADWPEDFEFLEGELRARAFDSVDFVVMNDVHGALRAATADGIGACIICGTGANVGARAADRQLWHAGFWLPYPSGATLIGRNAVLACISDSLGIGPATSLSSRLTAFLGVESVEDVLHHMTARAPVGGPTTDLALLAENVLDEADAGDAVAAAIVLDLGRVLGTYARLAAAYTGLPAGAPLVLAGGVFRNRSSLLDRAIAAQAPGLRPIRSTAEPAVGALLLAMDRVARRLPAAEVVGVPAPAFFRA